MTENKQFTFDRDTVAPNIKTPIVFKEGERLSLGEVLDKLNELNDDNQEVFNSIDNRIRYYQEFLEHEKRNGRNIMILEKIIDDLKDLKKIKKDDVNG